MNGFVSFVGSGPGDPELLTLKALNRLQRADVVLFDDLSSGSILEKTRSGAELVGVGKRAGRKSPKQHHVSQLLIDYAKQEARVVRLKSGDPGIFGRLEEELSAISKADIPFEIIPGVTSASAAAAAAYLPLTRRLKARRLQFITGHDVDGGLPKDLNLQALADPNCITAIYMPKRTFPELAQKLISFGLSPKTEAILAENISASDQDITKSSLSILAKKLEIDPGTATGVILLGPLTT